MEVSIFDPDNPQNEKQAAIAACTRLIARQLAGSGAIETYGHGTTLIAVSNVLSNLALNCRKPDLAILQVRAILAHLETSNVQGTA